MRGKLWQRRPIVPDDVRARLQLSAGERVLAAAADTDGRWVVATDASVVVDGRRVLWSDVERAGWDDEASTLTIVTMRSPEVSAENLRSVLPEPGAVPETVHERVTASIVTTRRVSVRTGAGFRVVVRRVPLSGELICQVILDRTQDPADAQVQAEVDEAVAELKSELGI